MKPVRSYGDAGPNRGQQRRTGRGARGVAVATGRVGRALEGELEEDGRGEAFDQANRDLDQVAHVDLLVVQLEHAGIDSRQIQNVVDDLQQV